MHAQTNLTPHLHFRRESPSPSLPGRRASLIHKSGGCPLPFPCSHDASQYVCMPSMHHFRSTCQHRLSPKAIIRSMSAPWRAAVRAITTQCRPRRSPDTSIFLPDLGLARRHNYQRSGIGCSHWVQDSRRFLAHSSSNEPAQSEHSSVTHDGGSATPSSRIDFMEDAEDAEELEWDDPPTDPSAASTPKVGGPPVRSVLISDW
jgi:hypothetical protein